MKIGVPKEIMPGERRVALVPDAVSGLVKARNDEIIKGACITHEDRSMRG